MSGALYSWFGYIQNNSTGQTSGVFGPLTADLDAAGFSIVNVGLLSSGDISTGGLTVNGCATGPGGVFKICDQMDTENLATVGSLNVETTSTLIGDVDVQSTMHMPNAEPLNTVNLFSVTNISGTGPPTSTPDKGALAFTDVDQILWVYDGTVWKDVSTNIAPDLASVLAVGNTTGTSDIFMSAGQQLTYANGVRLGMSGLTTGTTSATGINIGNNLTVSNGIDTISIGRQASSSVAGGVAIGERSLSNGGVSIGSVAQSPGIQAVCVGQQATTGTGPRNTVVGHLSRLGDTCNDCMILGFTSLSAPSCSHTIILGSGSGTGPTSTSNLISIGAQQNVQGSQTVKIGRGLAGTGVNNTAVGDSIVLTGTSNNSSILGAANTVPTGTTGLSVLGSSNTISGTPDNSVCAGRANTIGSANSVVLGTASSVSASGSNAIGNNAVVNTGATNSTALGTNSTVNVGHANSLAVCGGSTTASNQFMVGDSNLTTSVPGSLLMNSSIPTNSTNNFLVLSKMAGAPTGAANSGALTFNTANNTFYGRTGASWVPFVTGSIATPNLSQVLSTGNNTTGNNINVTVGDTIDFSGGMKLRDNNLIDVNNNVAAEIVDVAAGLNPCHPGFSAGPLSANISTVSSAADANLNIASKGIGSIELITATTARTHATGYMISDFQESAGLQNAVTQTIPALAPTTRIVTGNQIYNFSVSNAFLMADTVNNRMNLRPNSLYTVTSNFRYQEGTNHTNNVDLTYVMTYFDGVSANIIYRDTKSYPVAGPGSNGGYVQLSQLVKTNANPTQWVALDLIANGSNGSLLISELRFQIAKVN